MKRIFFLILVCVFTKTKSQTYASSNFSLISVISPETFTNSYGGKYSGCWGWYQSSLNKEYAIACSSMGTYWVDVTNPATPTVSAYFAGTSSLGVWREVKTYQNYCYVICDDGGSTGFQIFDMSNLPTSVTKVYEGTSYFKRAHTLWVDGNKLYVAGITYSNNTSSSMNVYSLATPTAPVLLRSLKQDAPFISYVHDMMPVNDTVFASCGNQGLYVFKFNTGSNTFTQLGSLTSYTASGFNHSSALTPNRKTLVLTDEVPASLPIKILNVQNLSNIQVLTTTNQYPNTTPHNPFMVSNSLCFMSSYQDGLQLYNISSPSTPTLVGYFDTFFQAGGNNNIWSGDDYDGQWGSYPYFPSKNIFALDQNNGIFMLKTPLYQNPSATFNNPSIICAGNNLNVTNTSTSATNYNWTFSGGSPATSTLANPSVVYNTPGIYTISLTSSNSTTTTATITKTITVTSVAGSVSYTNASCGTCTDGIASIAPISGTSPYTYTWIPTGGNSATAINLAPACYSVNVNDANNCSLSQTVCVGFSTDLQSSGSSISNLILYPNPAKNSVTVELQGTNFNYSVYNNLGQLLVINKNNVNKTVINLTDFSKGIYFIMVENGNQKIRRKLIID
ncbi:MAG: choice-of-anchor B family protein [Bacteroidota bacterium]|nr:choice-of-anchor B family protein [Bacteroidota bacterium]